MLFGVFNVRIIGAVILTAFIIKLMDDYLDDDITFLRPLIKNMGKGILPYCIMFFSISCLLDAELSISLVSSAYIIGMLSDFNRRLTFKLRGYQESILIFIVLTLVLGFHEMVSSMLIIFITQLIDDIIDINKDSYYNNKNIAIKIGVVEAVLITFILALITFKISPIKLITCLSVFSLIEILEYHTKLEDKEWI